MQVALRVGDVEALADQLVADAFDQIALGVDQIAGLGPGAQFQVDAAFGQRGDQHLRHRLLEHLGMPGGQRQQGVLGGLEVVVVAHADGQVDAALGVGGEIDDDRGGDQAVGQHDHPVVDGAQAGLEHPDLLDRALHAGGLHVVAGAERAQHDQHHARGDVGQRVLQRQADRQAGRAEHCQHRGHRHADLLQGRDHHHHHHRRVGDVAQEAAQGDFHVGAGHDPLQRARQPLGQPQADQQDRQGAEQGQALGLRPGGQLVYIKPGLQSQQGLGCQGLRCVLLRHAGLSPPWPSPWPGAARCRPRCRG